MKRNLHHVTIAAAALLLAAVGSGGSLYAQVRAEVAPQERPAMAVPIRVTGAKIRQVPESAVRRVDAEVTAAMVEVLDLGVEVTARALDTLPPSLQPLLHVGGTAFPIQRVEYSNWDLRNEQPIDPELPTGERRTFHFFIPAWQELPSGQVMFLSVLTADEIRQATGGELSADTLIRVLPELERKVLRYAPREFVDMDP